MKDYSAWQKRKIKLESRSRPPRFNERDIWWCAIGLNIGYEEDGKNEKFERPVCILKKLNKNIFVGIPMTSVVKQDKYHFPYKLHDIQGNFILSQIRLLSAKRLERRMGRVEENIFKTLKRACNEIVL